MAELDALNKVQSEFAALGATFVTVSPELSEHSAGLIKQRKLGFDILQDRGNELAARFGLRHQLPADLQKVYLGLGADLPIFNGDDSWTLPLAARYIIDAKSSVRYAHVDTVYQARPEPEETVDALRAMVAASA